MPKFLQRNRKGEEEEEMQIKVKCECGEEKCGEWAIIELQGVVEVHSSFHDRLHNLQIGILCRPSPQEVYIFEVGYHEMTGTKVALKKPYLVLKKSKSMNGDVKDSESKVELEVAGVIRRRIIFKTRPRVPNFTILAIRHETDDGYVESRVE